MAWFKRIFFFMLVNIAVIVTISILTSLLGLNTYLSASGIDYSQMMGFCLVWGMGGAFISLAMSRMIAKWSMGVRVIDPATRDPELQELVQTVYRLAQGARLPAMPEVGIYDSPEVNAFATGPTKARSLVAVSTGLLHRMRTHEVEGVLGHEVAHIANGDMVTMTLIQGVVNAFVMFLARAIAFAVTTAMRGNDEREESHGPGFMYHIIVMVLEIGLMFLGMLVIAWFSRLREYRADVGGARLAGRNNMIDALQALRRTHELVDSGAQPAMQALKISSRPGGFMALFSTHPPLEERIARLETMST